MKSEISAVGVVGEIILDKCLVEAERSLTLSRSRKLPLRALAAKYEIPGSIFTAALVAAKADTL